MVIMFTPSTPSADLIQPDQERGLLESYNNLPADRFESAPQLKDIS
jgi:hypothetical protein